MSPVPLSIPGTGAAVGPSSSCPSAQLASAKPDGTDPEDRTTADMLDCAQTDRQTAPGPVNLQGRGDATGKGGEGGAWSQTGFIRLRICPYKEGKASPVPGRIRDSSRLLDQAF